MGLSEAIALAARGFRVFPLVKNGTKPLRAGWPETASSNVDVVSEMFRTVWAGDTPNVINGDPGYNVGVLTTDMLVVDVDMKNGKQGLQEFLKYQPDTNTLTVKTKSGGFHYYYDTLGMSFQNRVNGLGDGVDIRSYHGYVVGPGSTVDDGVYSIINDREIALIPQVLAETLSAPRIKKEEKEFPYLDDPRCVQHALSIIERTEGCCQGQQSQKVFEIACAIRDYGVSEDTALWLLMEFWNEKNSPELSYEDMELRVQNAYKYAVDSIGNASPLLAFEGVVLPPKDESPSEHGDTEGPSSLSYQGNEDKANEWFFGNTPSLDTLKPRPWNVKGLLLGGDVTTVSASGAGGKTTFMLNTAVHLAAGSEDVMGYENMLVGRPVKSVIHSAEDGLDELAKRVYAACLQNGYDPADILPHIALSSGKDRDLKFAMVDNAGNPMANEKAIPQILKICKKGDVGFICIDPLANLHTLNENDSVQMTFVMSVFNKLAAMTGAGVMIMHHTQKLNDGSVASTRGSGAIINSSRIALVLNGCSEKEAVDFGVPLKDRPRVSWIADGKSNMAPKTDKRRWYIMQSVTLVTGDGVGVPMKYDVTTKRNLADERIARCVKDEMLREGMSEWTFKQGVIYLRDRCGEDMFVKTETDRAAEKLLRQIIMRTPDVMDVNASGRITFPQITDIGA